MIPKSTANIDLRLGYVTKFNDAANSVSIKTFDGVMYDNVQYDVNIAMMASPVSALPSRSADKPAVLGTLVWFTTINNVVKIVSAFSGDPAIVARSASNTIFSAANFTVVDPLLKLWQEGDTLVQAPGAIDKSLEHRIPGAWLLLKKQGDVILSTKDIGASLRLANDGSISLYGVKYNIQGELSQIREADRTLSLSLQSSYVDISKDLIDISAPSGDISLSGLSLALDAARIDISSSTVMGLSAAEIDVDSPNIYVTAGQSLTIICGDAVIEVSPGVIRFNAGAGKLLLNGAYPVVVAKTEQTTEITSIDDLAVSTSVRAGV